MRLASVEEISLNRLSIDQVEALAADIIGHPESGDGLTRLLELSDGVPFLVELLATGEPHPSRVVSDRAREIVLARMRDLPEPAVRLVECSSVAATELTDNLLRAVLDGTGIAVDETVAAAIAAGVLRMHPEGEGYQFHHALLREAVGHTMLPGRRAGTDDGPRCSSSPTGLSALPLSVATAHHWIGAADPARALVTALHAGRGSAGRTRRTGKRRPFSAARSISGIRCPIPRSSPGWNAIASSTSRTTH